MKYASQRGFAALELVLVMVIVGIVGLVVWRVVDSNAPQTTVQDSTVIDTTTVPAVTQTSQLDSVTTTLDQTDIEGSIETELDTQSTF